jgi:small subunit ribosomal protein S1
VVSPSQPEGLIEMSYSQALGWRNLEAAQGTERILTVKAFALAKTKRSQKASGLRVCFEEGIHKGIRGFLPNMEISRGLRAEDLVGHKLEIVVLIAEPGRGSEFGNLVVSQRAAGAVKEALTVEGMVENTLVDGRIIQFIKASPRDHKVSALVQLENGVVGLVHRTEVSNQTALNELYKVGDSLKLAVRAIDRNRLRVSLSLKLVSQLEKLATIAVGQIVTAEVLRHTEYGYFCGIGGGLEGLLHNSDLARLSGKKFEEFKAGDRVEVKLLSYNPDGSRMALGRRQLV